MITKNSSLLHVLTDLLDKLIISFKLIIFGQLAVGYIPIEKLRTHLPDVQIIYKISFQYHRELDISYPKQIPSIAVQGGNFHFLQQCPLIENV